MGGATAAHFLRKQFGSRCSITLFEQSGRIGGRMKSATFAGRLVETGASIFHSKNRYMSQLAREFGLTVGPLTKTDGRFAFYNGFGSCAFSTLGCSRITGTFRMLWRYGLDTLKTTWFVDAMIRDFSKIYRLQDSGHCFTTTAHLLTALRPEFLQMTTCSYEKWLTEKLKLNEKITNELAYGLISNNYCQDQTVHAFVGFISFATVLPKLQFVLDGNELLPANLVKQALSSNPNGAPKDFVHARVQSISPLSSDNRYAVEYLEDGQKRSKQEKFDYVILAAPLHQESAIEGKKSLILPKFTYQRVDHSFFSGVLKEESFGLKANLDQPEQEIAILPTKSAYLEDVKCLFRSLISSTAEEGTLKRTWAVFSEPKRISDPIGWFSTQYFRQPSGRAGLHVPTDDKPLLVQWLAYPTYKPVENPEKELGQFVLAPRLYYVNAIEHAASCMEMAAIGGRNVALLIAADRQAAGQIYNATEHPKRIIVNKFSIPSIHNR
ncbi:Prenylcysteine oxidase [Fasciolopsis buskii]|uniref:Prenylcysteine oxidase n=1 Tax=Fasciolopsis buskii TaxID=27845 RepID=A0A8E0RJ04_9TREM|nr:Prenylcysteine oxidase [Fasciolopsis buski]